MAFDDSWVHRLFTIESGGNPENVTGSNRGLGQFSPDLERKYGITDWKNYGQQAAAVRREYNDFAPRLSRSLGRDPTGGEFYLAHQQGLDGAIAHFANPEGAAWQNVRKFYKSDDVAKQAIWGNIPDHAKDSPTFNKEMFPDGVNSVTSGDFSQGWARKFDEGRSPATGVTEPVAEGSVPVGAPIAAAGGPGQQGLLAGTDLQPDIGSALNNLNSYPTPRLPPIQMAVPVALRQRLQQG